MAVWFILTFNTPKNTNAANEPHQTEGGGVSNLTGQYRRGGCWHFELVATNLGKCSASTDWNIYAQLIEGLIENSLRRFCCIAVSLKPEKSSVTRLCSFGGIIMRFTWNHWVGKAAMHKARITPARSSSHTLYMHIYIYTHTLTHSQPNQSPTPFAYYASLCRFLAVLAQHSPLNSRCCCCCCCFLQAALFVIVAWLAAWKNIFI